jgi:hypothetical protein
VWGLKGFIGIEGYKKGYLVKIRVLFIGNLYWDGGLKKGFWEIFINV